MPAVALALTLHPKRVWLRYNGALKQSPLRTKSLTCAAAFALGDTLAQLSSKQGGLVRRVSELDVARSARMAGFGLLFAGPAGHNFYSWLDQVW